MANKLISLLTFLDNQVYDESIGVYEDMIEDCFKNNNCARVHDIISTIDNGNLHSLTALLTMLYLSERGLKPTKKDQIYWANKSFNKYKIIECGEFLANTYVKEKKYRNYQKAYEIYQELATINHHIALTALGNFYRFGLGDIKKNLNKAEDYYKRAIKAGNLIATKRLAGVYRKQRKYHRSLQILFEKKQKTKRCKELKLYPNGSDLFREY